MKKATEDEEKRAAQTLVKLQAMEKIRKERNAAREAHKQEMIIKAQQRYNEKVKRAKEEAYAKKLEAIKVNRAARQFLLYCFHSSHQHTITYSSRHVNISIWKIQMPCGLMFINL